MVAEESFVNPLDDFDEIVDLHDQIKNFKTVVAQKVLLNFYMKVSNEKGSIDKPKLAKFGKISYYNREPEQKDKERLNLSSSTTCAYTLGEYLTLWEETSQNKIDPDFYDLTCYWNYIIAGLKNPNISELQLTDEFSILNILSLLKKIEEKIQTKIENENVATVESSKKLVQDKQEILLIIEALCKRFIENQFASIEKGIHPVILYKFMMILEQWNFDFNKKMVERINHVFQERHDLDKLRPKYRSNDGYYFWIMDELYNKGKYEIYRQISLFNSDDKTLFDVKKLIYSLLTVRRNCRYRNSKIVDEALKIIFQEQYGTGLLPVGLVVNNEFVKKKNKNSDGEVEFENREISTNPILSSFECFSDMFSEEDLREDLKKSYKKFELAFEWAQKRVRKDSTQKDNYLGWYPEYESTHAAESWASAHILLFLKKYCEFLSEIIADRSRAMLHAQKISDDESTQLCETYGIIDHIDYMAKHEECRSALIFGPPGCGKSIVGKYLCIKLSKQELKPKQNTDEAISTCAPPKQDPKWDYIELTPAMFLAQGQAKIMPQANEIFKRLMRIKKAVVFFKEVNEFQESHGESGSAWFVADFVARFAELIKHKHIKLILASHMRIPVNRPTKSPPLKLSLGIDPSLVRLGRIDIVLPMGGVSWYQRLKMLYKALNDKKISGSEDLHEVTGALLKVTDKPTLKSNILNSTLLPHDQSIEAIRTYLERTNYISRSRIMQILEAIFVRGDIELYNTFFASNPKTKYSDFEECELQVFQNLLKSGHLTDYIRFSPKNTTKSEVSDLSEENIFAPSV